MRAIGIAALVGGLIATPVSAATLTEMLSVTVGPAVVPYSPTSGVGFPFPLFNSSVGTLDNVSVALGGSISWASLVENPILTLSVDYEGNSLAVSDFHLSTLTPIMFKISGSLDPIDPSDLAPFIGTGSGQFDFVFSTDSPDDTVTIESNGQLTGSITYDYTPNSLKLTPSVPEPSTWAMMLVGFAGLAFAGSGARGGFRKRVRLAGAC